MLVTKWAHDLENVPAKAPCKVEVMPIDCYREKSTDRGRMRKACTLCRLQPGPLVHFGFIAAGIPHQVALLTAATLT